MKKKASQLHIIIIIILYVAAAAAAAQVPLVKSAILKSPESVQLTAVSVGKKKNVNNYSFKVLRGKDNKLVQSKKSKKNSIIIKGLEPGTNYCATVQIMYVNKTTSETSKPLCFSTPQLRGPSPSITSPPAPPASSVAGQPTTLSTKNITSVSWTGSWVAGTEGNPTETCALKCVAFGGACTTTAIKEVSALTRTNNTQQEATLTGLSPNTKFTCYAVAINSVGSVCSAKRDIQTLPDIPPAPTNLQLAPVVGQPLRKKLTWIAPTPTGGALTGYTVTCTDTDEATNRRIISIPSPTTTTATVGQGGTTNAPLTPAAIFSCSVKANNGSSGTSNASTPVLTSQPKCADPSTSAGYAISTITGDPETDGWFHVGNSNQLGTYVKHSNEASFKLFTTSFVLTQSIIDAAKAAIPSSGNPGNTGESLAKGAFQVGDVIVGVGVKYVNGREGSEESAILGSVSPDGKGIGLLPATDVAACAADASSETCGFTSALNLGDFSISGSVDGNQNGRFYSTFRIITGIDPSPTANCASSSSTQSFGTTGCPYGNKFLSTIGTNPTDNTNPTFHMALPLRAIVKRVASKTTIASVQLLYNVGKLQLDNHNNIAGVPIRDFASGWKFAFSHTTTLDDFVTTVGMGQLVCSA